MAASDHSSPELALKDGMVVVTARMTPRHERLYMNGRMLLVVVTALLASCAGPSRFALSSMAALGPRGTSAEQSAEATPQAQSQLNTGVLRLNAAARVGAEPMKHDLSDNFPADNKLTAASDAMPMKDFLHYVFGDLLQVSYVIAEGIPGLDQPITLNVQAPVSSRAIYKLVADILTPRHIVVNLKDDVYFVVPADGKGKDNVVIGLGAKAEDVPDAPSKILQIVPLRYGANANIERTLKDLVDAQVVSDNSRSALFVTGERDAVLKVLDVVRLLDQPATRASALAVVNLTYIGTKDYTDQLMTLMENEGVPVGLGRGGDGKTLVLVPLERLGSVVVFATSEELLARAEYWTRQIDRPGKGTAEQYFVYHPKYARALDLGLSLRALISPPGGIGTAEGGNSARDTRSALGETASGEGLSGMGGAGGNRGSSGASGTLQRREAGSAGGGNRGEQSISIRGDGVTVSVDPRSNSLIFYTTGPRYEALLPMVRRLDIAPRQILIEATLAEVDMTGAFAHGVEFALKSSSGKAAASTLGQLGLPSGGIALNYISNITNSVKATLTQNDSQVNILSNPFLIVRDGAEASITVGNDVPTLGATTSSPTTSSLTVTSVLYRRTGLTLSISPTINAEGTVVLRIDQTISDTVPGASSVAGAPEFFDRSVRTEVVAKSGQTVLLAGLISLDNSVTSTRVPGFGSIPGLGWLFNSVSKNHAKTELVLLITPRVLESSDDWESVKGGVQKALQYITLPGPKASAPEPHS